MEREDSRLISLCKFYSNPAQPHNSLFKTLILFKLQIERFLVAIFARNSATKWQNSLREPCQKVKIYYGLLFTSFAHSVHTRTDPQCQYKLLLF